MKNKTGFSHPIFLELTMSFFVISSLLDDSRNEKERI
jgi:hypothetical protein